MHDTQLRLERLEQAVELRKARRRMGEISVLSIVSCVLAMAELGLLVHLGDGVLRTTTQRYFFGASMLSDDVGGYVLVGVIAFALAVVFTVLCMKYRKK